MAVPIKKGVPFDCLMFEVRCKQECVENGLRQASKCPYDNYKGVSPKGVNAMGNSTNRPAPKPAPKPAPAQTGNGNGGFTPTFRKYADMNSGEQAAFKQGAKTVENKVKQNLGLTKPKDKDN